MSTPPLAACQSPRGGRALNSWAGSVCRTVLACPPLERPLQWITHPSHIPVAPARVSCRHGKGDDSCGGRLTFCFVLIIGQRGDFATNDVNLKKEVILLQKKEKRNNPYKGKKPKTVTMQCACINCLKPCCQHQNSINKRPRFNCELKLHFIKGQKGRQKFVALLVDHLKCI